MLASAALAMLAPAAFSQPQDQAIGDVIVVTAARAEESRDSSAAPVAVMGQAEIERLGAQHIAEALNRLPGVFINRGNGVEHLTAIRSAVLSGGAGAGSFLYLEDGIALRAPGFANLNGLMEAADGLAGRLEVIRGPGSAVYGSNALHGLVNVITPEPEDAGRLLEVEAGSFGRARLRTFAGGETRFGSAWGGVSVRHENGWREDAALTKAAAMGRADWATGATEWSLRGALIDIDQETATFVDGFKAFEDEALSQQNADPLAFRNVRAARANLRADHRISDTWSANAVVYGRSNQMDFRLHFLPSLALEATGHDSIGVQSGLVWETERSRVIFGADADLTDGFLTEIQTEPTRGPFIQGLHYDYTVEALVLAGFVQARHALTPALSIEGGVRLEETRYAYDNRAPDGVLGRYLRPSDRSDDFSTVTPNLGLTYQAADGFQLFARAARGVRAPQTDELYRLQPGQQIEGIAPEELDSVEAGLRWRPGSRGRIELVGFAMEKRNVFFRDADGFNVTDGASRHHGIELDAGLTVTDSFSLAGSATWAIHEYAFDRPVSSGSETIVDGARLDTAPEWLWNLRALWEPRADTVFEAEWVHVGEYFADAANTASYEGHDLLNLRASHEFGSGWQVFTAVRNVFDTRYAERADFAFGGYRYFPGEPRSVSVGIRITG
jgi:outer membrane receptor protein involved in Fe transport